MRKLKELLGKAQITGVERNGSLVIVYGIRDGRGFQRDFRVDEPIAEFITEYMRAWPELAELIEAAEAYQGEFTNPVPDYVLRQRYRKQLFDALAAIEEGGR